MKRKNLLKVSVIATVLLSFMLALAACTDPRLKEKPALAAALAAYANEGAKKAVSDVSFSFTHYIYEGEPVRMTDTMHMERAQADGYIYANGKIETTEPMPRSGILGFILMTNILPVDIKEFLNGNTAVTFEAGSYGGTLNVRGDFVPYGKKADYVYNTGNGAFKTWGALLESEAEQFINDANRPSSNGLKVRDLIMTPLILSGFDWAAAGDTSGNAFNKGTKQFNYTFSAGEALIKDYIVKQIDVMIEESFPTAEDKESEDYKDVVYFYNTYRDMVLGWFKFQPFTMSVTADGDGRITGSDTNLQLSLKVPDADIIEFMTNEGITPEGSLAIPGLPSSVTGIDQFIKTIHMVFTAPNKESQVFQLDFDIKISERYSYGGGMPADKNSPVFIPYAHDEPGRFKMAYSAKEGSEYREWNILDLEA
ncbi:MAG: hypothetical protein LBC13_03035 [Clostridiales bacterium]|nr:hypothetical protein [Clostridiales bacterium]